VRSAQIVIFFFSSSFPRFKIRKSSFLPFPSFSRNSSFLFAVDRALLFLFQAVLFFFHLLAPPLSWGNRENGKGLPFFSVFSYNILVVCGFCSFLSLTREMERRHLPFPFLLGDGMRNGALPSFLLFFIPASPFPLATGRREATSLPSSPSRREAVHWSLFFLSFFPDLVLLWLRSSQEVLPFLCFRHRFRGWWRGACQKLPNIGEMKGDFSSFLPWDDNIRSFSLFPRADNNRVPLFVFWEDSLSSARVGFLLTFSFTFRSGKIVDIRPPPLLADDPFFFHNRGGE